LKELGEHPVKGGTVAVMEGKYGPYVKWDKVNATLPKGTDPAELTMDMAVELIDAKASKGGKKTSAKKTAPKKEFKPNPQPEPEIFEDKPENKRLILDHFAKIGLDTTNKEAMISVYQAMINKPLDVAEKILADFCRNL
jgi:hypothetical protein